MCKDTWEIDTFHHYPEYYLAKSCTQEVTGGVYLSYKGNWIYITACSACIHHYPNNDRLDPPERLKDFIVFTNSLRRL